MNDLPKKISRQRRREILTAKKKLRQQNITLLEILTGKKIKKKFKKKNKKVKKKFKKKFKKNLKKNLKKN